MDEADKHLERAALWVAQSQHSQFRADSIAQRSLHKWLTASEAHAAAFANALGAFQGLERVRAFRHVDLQPLLQTQRESQNRDRIRLRRSLSISAALTLGLCLPLLPNQLIAAPAVYATRVGEQRTVTLEDGSQITLNSGTRVVVQRNGRYCDIDVIRGETFFNMSEKPRRPTRVFTSLGMVAGRARVFDVLQTAHEFRVIAVRGELSVSIVHQASAVLTQGTLGAGGRVPFKHVELHAGYIGTVRASLGRVDIRLETRTASDIDRLIAWRDGILSFSDEPATLVVESFNRYNREQLAIADLSLAALRLSGNFQLNDPQSFILALQRVYPAFKIVAERDPTNGAINLRAGAPTASQRGRKMVDAL